MLIRQSIHHSIHISQFLDYNKKNILHKILKILVIYLQNKVKSRIKSFYKVGQATFFYLIE